MSEQNKKPRKRNNARLSSQILEYFQKYGQNRDLEKYLRLGTSSNKSPSEGSLSIRSSCASGVAEKDSKSLDQLNFVKGTEEEVLQGDTKKFQHGNASSGDSPPMVQPLITVRTKRVVDKDKPRKAYTFNCESNIAISLLPFSQAVSMPDLAPSRLETSTEYSQTDFEESKLNQSTFSQDEASGQNKSPDNSRKTDKRLEWDSLGDVGYNKVAPLDKKQSRSMSTLEKSVLKDFFADQGIEIKFSAAGSESIQKLPNIQEENSERSNQGAIPKTTKEKWRATLESIKQKYSRPDSVSGVGSQKEFSQFGKLSSELHSTPNPKVEILEKFCQTSFIKTKAKEVQVNFSNAASTRSAMDAGSVTSNTSFEYFSNPKDNETSDKENMSPRTQSKERERRLRQSAKRILLKQKALKSPQKKADNEPTDLEMGIKLLCSLIESKSLNDKQKKSLARKIVAKITNGSLPLSENSTDTSSVVSKRSLIKPSKQTEHEDTSEVTSRSNITSEVPSSRSVAASEDDNCLVTSRQIVGVPSYGPQSRTNSSVQQNSAESNGKESSTVRSRTNSDVTQRERRKEVDNCTMNEWLDPITKSEFEYNRRKEAGEVPKAVEIDVLAGGDGPAVGRTSKIFQFVQEEKKTHLKWIETEIERLENLKHLLLTNDDGEKRKALKPRQEIIAYPAHLTKPCKGSSGVGEQSAQMSSSCSSKQPEKPEKTYEITRAESEVETINPTKNYRRVVKKITDVVKSGSQSGEERPVKVTTFSIEEEKRFPKKDYVNSTQREERSKLETPKSTESESIQSYAQQRKKEFLKMYKKSTTRLYDQPAVSDHYSEPKDNCLKQRFATSNAYTTVSSSDFFISSDSVSIPISGSSSCTTTTHQYDNKIAIGVQTTDSILRTRPIYSTAKFKCGCIKKCTCRCQKATIREYRPKLNKQCQANPPALAYVISFETLKKCDDDASSRESLTLQEHLERRRPDFQRSATKRRDVLKKLHILRQERDTKIREIVENTSISSMSRKLNELPPPPTKYTRVFPTREMKAMNKRKCSQLSEVVQKKENEKKERRKKSNKILVSVFNKKLQRRVHRGQLSLEHSGTVI